MRLIEPRLGVIIMSTRGGVGWKVDNSWKAVYNHWDSYPEGLGAEVWETIKSRGLKDVLKGIKKVGDWREYLSGGVCEFCGKKAGQPHSINAKIDTVEYNLKRPEYKSRVTLTLYFANLPAWKGRDKEIEEMVESAFQTIETYQKTGYTDPEAKYHKHGSGVKDQFTPKSCDALWIEWLYIIDGEKEKLLVYSNYDTGKKKMEKGFNGTEYESSVYAHKLVAEIDLNGDMPDWEKIGQMG